jgi:CO/xanthine dehydrogenase FAD-binding subunit
VRIIAGGTGIYELANRGLLSEIETLVDVTGLDLAYVRNAKTVIRMGAATTMSELLESEVLKESVCGAIADALRAIQPFQVKNVATIGGAICTALPFFDLPTALIAADAAVTIAPSNRVEKLYDFIQGYFTIDLAFEEFVKEIMIALDGAPRYSAFQKFALSSDDWAIINCAVSLSLGHGGTIKDPLVVFGGGVGGKPTRVGQAEKSLEGTKAREEELDVVFDEISAELETTTDVRSSAEFRQEIAKVLGRRTTLMAYERAKKGQLLQ